MIGVTTSTIPFQTVVAIETIPFHSAKKNSVKAFQTFIKASTIGRAPSKKLFQTSEAKDLIPDQRLEKNSEIVFHADLIASITG